MKQLTEPEAWRRIGNDILNGGEMPRGLCQRAIILAMGGEISWWLEADMAERIELQVTTHAGEGAGQYPYLAAPGEEREARAMLAYLMALEAEDES